MDWTAFALSLQLASWTVAVLLPVGLTVARILAWHPFPGRRWVEAALALPLVLPPTVLGFYLSWPSAAIPHSAGSSRRSPDIRSPSALPGCCWHR